MGAGQFFSYCDPDQVQIFFRKRNWGVVISFLTIKKKKGIWLYVFKHWLLKGWIIGFMLQIQLLLIVRS